MEYPFPIHLFPVNLTSGSMVNAVRTYRGLLHKPDLRWQKAGNGSEGISPATKSIGLQGACVKTPCHSEVPLMWQECH